MKTNIFSHLYHSKKKHTILLMLFLLLSVLLTMGLAICLGPITVHPCTTFQILLHKIPYIGNLIPPVWSTLDENIVLSLRLPRVCLGMLVGASLSICGVTMQALFRNHLADPFILGVSSGGSAFATLGMLFGTFSFLGTYALSISAFFGASITIIFVYLISRVHGRIHITQLLLSGTAVSMIMDGFTNIIKLSAPNALGLHNAEFWMSGSLAGAKWEYLKLPFWILLCSILFLMLHHRSLNLLLLGEENAYALGINVRRFQKQLLLVTSLIAGAAIAVSGTIGFVGLIVPHFTRLIVGSDHKKVLPVSALLGGILVVWVDVFARLLIAPEELPVGVLTAVIGGPIFLWMLKKNS